MNDNTDAHTVGELPIAELMLGLRCCHPTGRFTTRPCGRPARWHRTGVYGIPWAAFCDDHRRAGDLPAPVGLAVRRVRINLTVDLVAAIPEVGPSKVEATIAVKDALEREQARVSVLDVTTTMVRNGRPPVPVKASLSSGGGK